jgi:hypothetical protein
MVEWLNALIDDLRKVIDKLAIQQCNNSAM